MADGRTALISGASAGLGAEMARQLAAKGHDLALCARRADRLEALRSEIVTAHPDRIVSLRTLDVTDDEQVFAVFRSFRDELGRLDRVIVNAGLGKGGPVGTGHWAGNRETVMTNVVGALAQAEAAVEAFREQRSGHLVMISSMAAVRGLPKAVTTYAATKAAVAHLAEGLRTEFHGSDIRVTTLYPGYIASEMNDQLPGDAPPMMVSTEKGVRAMVDAIEKEKGSACVPPLPWAPLSVVMRHVPVALLKRIV